MGKTLKKVIVLVVIAIMAPVFAGVAPCSVPFQSGAGQANEKQRKPGFDKSV